MSSHSTLDFSVLSHASESTPVKTSESLQDELQAVNRELGSMKRKWQEERQQLLGDNAVLKDAANRLDLEVQDVKERAEKKERKHDKARNGVLGVCFLFLSVGCFAHLYWNSQELDEAKQTIADLEEGLKAERTRLRVLTLEQTRAEREKENVLLQLRRNESDMEDVKLQLQRVKRNNNELEGELRGACCYGRRTAHSLIIVDSKRHRGAESAPSRSQDCRKH
jgi:myosin protein heavy chain